jgi:SET domain-containing protein
MLAGAVEPGASTTHGLGLRASALIRAGTVVWFPCPQCPTWTSEQLALLPGDVVARLDTWGHTLADGRLLVPCAGAYLMNHSCAANVLDFGLDFGVAVVDIPASAEVTCDYGTFSADDQEWTMRCACTADDCRGVVRTVDHHDGRVRSRWAERVAAVLPRVRAVPQPLGALLRTHSATFCAVLAGMSNVEVPAVGDSVVRPGFTEVTL